MRVLILGMEEHRQDVQQVRLMVAIRPSRSALYFIDVRAKVPFRFGKETLERVTCARVMFEVEEVSRGPFQGWGESPLSAQWAWPSDVPLSERETALRQFCCEVLDAWSAYDTSGHPLTLGHAFLRDTLPELLGSFNARRSAENRLPYLAALMCCAPFDIALHDAYGHAAGRSIYDCYSPRDMPDDLTAYIDNGDVDFRGLYPSDFFSYGTSRIPAWHAVGGIDTLSEGARASEEPGSGFPATLEEWIRKDRLSRLKIKLSGTDFEWDYERVMNVADVSMPHGVTMLGVDFNGMVTDPTYVEHLFERICRDRPKVLDALCYIEEPFTPELLDRGTDVSAVAKWAPCVLDESAHDWRVLGKARELGYSGVVLKTCKTQTEALLTMSWAKRYGMEVLTQDLTNPMLAQIAHVQLGAHASPDIGIETNSMQFYPDASADEAKVHPGLYQRVDGFIDLRTISGPGFGYRIEEIDRQLPQPARTSWESSGR